MGELHVALEFFQRAGPAVFLSDGFCLYDLIGATAVRIVMRKI